MADVTYPGVYVEETPFAGRTIEGVATSTTAFIGATPRGRTRKPRLVTSFVEFEHVFGGLSPDHPITFSVRQFFEDGGRRALICRVWRRRRRGRLTDDDLSHPELEAQRRGLWLLERVDEPVSIVVIPPLGREIDVGRQTWDAAVAWAKRRRAMVIVDPPATWAAASDVTQTAIGDLVTASEDLTNAALYFPRFEALDPLNGNRPRSFAPGGAVAGVYARTDLNRGVWKAPAGLDAGVQGATGLAVNLSSADSDSLNPRGINTIRTFPGRGIVVWGARTLRGADALASEWKYVPVRRLALYIEASIDEGTQWAVFEPNDEPLWTELRRHVGNFLHTLFQNGAFPANRPQEAYFVRCDRTTMTQNDIDNGRVNVLVGFAAVKPAEFVILRIAISAKQPA